MQIAKLYSILVAVIIVSLALMDADTIRQQRNKRRCEMYQSNKKQKVNSSASIPAAESNFEVQWRRRRKKAQQQIASKKNRSNRESEARYVIHKNRTSPYFYTCISNTQDTTDTQKLKSKPFFRDYKEKMLSDLSKINVERLSIVIVKDVELFP
jgi:hypothetical protein